MRNTIETPKTTAIIVDFDAFSRTCPYFTSDTDVNNGYGCTHPECTEITDGDGECHTYSCPFCRSLNKEDLSNHEIDRDGCDDSEFTGENGEFLGSNDYGVLVYDNDKFTPKMLALAKYQKYLHRYDPAWLKAHGY